MPGAPKWIFILASASALACGGPGPTGAGPPVRNPTQPPAGAEARPGGSTFMTPSEVPPKPEPGDVRRLAALDEQIAGLRAQGQYVQTAPLLEDRARLLEGLGRLSEAVEADEMAAELYLQATPPEPVRSANARAEAARIRASLPVEPMPIGPP